jgi:hypothetical protein
MAPINQLEFDQVELLIKEQVILLFLLQQVFILNLLMAFILNLLVMVVVMNSTVVLAHLLLMLQHFIMD